MITALSDVASTRESGHERRVSLGRVDPADLAFGGLLALGAALIVFETRGLSFFADEWDFLLDRRGLALSTFLRPHGPHLVLIPILIYKVMLSVFGATSYLPFRLLTALDLVIVALVVGVICRRAWGKWWGLAPVLLLVTLGQGATSTLSPFQSGYALAVSAGLVALVALGSRRRHSDVVACAALIMSLASESQGIGFLAGAAVVLFIRGDWRRRAWVVLVPAVLYGLWYLKYGHQASETELSLWNTSLVYTVQGLSATISALLALSTVSSQTGLLDPTLGQPLALAAVAGIAYAAWRGWRARSLFWGVAGTLLVLWVAASVSNTAAIPRPPEDPRYLFANAPLLLVCVCIAVPRPRLPRGGQIAACAALAVIAATNASQYGPTHDSLSTQQVATRAEVGALEILRGLVPSNFSPVVAGAPGVVYPVQAGPFFSAVDSYGMIADSVPKLQRLGEGTRQIVDTVLQNGELTGLLPPQSGIRPATRPPAVLSGTAAPSRNCLTLGAGPLVIRGNPGTVELTASSGAPLSVALARFGSAYGVQVGQVQQGRTETLLIPSDRAPKVPWRIRLEGGSGARVCAAAV
jgi:hypothetical protein